MTWLALWQDATEVDMNQMVLALVKALHDLIRGGFIAYGLLPSLARRMLAMLDGSNDTTGASTARSRPSASP